jgi:hypothetical protein
MARREITKLSVGPLPLILAVVIHDGEHFSPHLDNIQRLSIQKYANPWLAPNSPRAEELSILIKRFAVDVFHALQKAPAYDPSWSELAIDTFSHLFEERATQRELPSLGGARL